MVSEFHEMLKTAGLEKSLQEGFLNGEFHTQWLLLQQAQHYGLPTRYMDWTAKWEVALYFAVFNEKDDHEDAQFWVYTVPENGLTYNGNSLGYLAHNPFEYKETIFLNSSGFASKDHDTQIAERRKARQHGRFCIQNYENIFIPLEEQPEYSPYLHKIVIPKALKKELREYLLTLNFKDETVYVEKNPEIEAMVSALKQKYKV